MAYAITALALTAVYLLLLIVNPPAAAGAGGFYIAAVLVLICGQRWEERNRHDRP